MSVGPLSRSNVLKRAYNYFCCLMLILCFTFHTKCFVLCGCYCVHFTASATISGGSQRHIHDGVSSLFPSYWYKVKTSRVKEGAKSQKQLLGCRIPWCPSGHGEAGRRLAEVGTRLCPHEESRKETVSPSPLGVHLSAPHNSPFYPFFNLGNFPQLFIQTHTDILLLLTAT